MLHTSLNTSKCSQNAWHHIYASLQLNLPDETALVPSPRAPPETEKLTDNWGLMTFAVKHFL